MHCWLLYLAAWITVATGDHGPGRLDALFEPNGGIQGFFNRNLIRKTTNSRLLCQGLFSPVDDSPRNDSNADCPVPNVEPADCKFHVKYRTLNGQCNNLLHPSYGAAGQPNQRLHDREDIPQRPNAAKVSRVFLRRITPEHGFAPPPIQSDVSLFVLCWGTQLHFDLVNIAQIHSNVGDCLDCCSLKDGHPACSHRIIDDDGTCLPYVDILPGRKPGCPDGEPLPKNLETAWLDLSNLYGTSEADQERLREFDGGRLKVLTKRKTGNTLPPLEPEIQGGCRNKNAPCFDSGSQAVNFDPGTVVMDGILRSEHNRIAKELKRVNPAWTDEQSFQAARAINIAQAQYITFNEFLPLLIGDTRARRSGILSHPHQYSQLYNSSLKPDIYISYSAAVSPGLLATSLPPAIVTPSNKVLVTHEGFFRPEILLNEGAVGEIVRTKLSNSPYMIGRMEYSTSRNFLRDDFGQSTDLFATILQLNRELGLPSYNKFRAACQIEVITSWDHLANVTGQERRIQLEELYESVDHIDLFVGGLAELPLAGALFGPVFACITTSMWATLRRADRFVFDTILMPQSLRPEQLHEIQKSTLARLICDNTDVKEIQPKAFLAQDKFLNNPVPCDSEIIPRVDISKFIATEAVFSKKFDEASVRKILHLAKTNVEQQQIEEEKNAEEESYVATSGAVATHASLSSTGPHSKSLFKEALIMEEATKLILNQMQDDHAGQNINFADFLDQLQIDLGGTVVELPENTCLVRPVPCDHTARYRTASGWCNNLKFPHYGASFTPLRRLLPPAYSDGLTKPRSLNEHGKALPSPREISVKVMNNHHHEHEKFSHMLMQWGQILDHDLVLVPISTAPDGKAWNCTPCDSHETVNKQCLPIRIPQDDPVMPSVAPDGSPACMPFTRSKVGQLKFGSREQVSVLTAYIDGSAIYGADDCHMRKLRSFQNGRLRSSFLPLTYDEVLPQDLRHAECIKHKAAACYEAGDERVNEHNGLAAMHTVLLRQHNQIADKLTLLNPHWTDEETFQETRHIVAAIFQHITYNEFLPRLIGRKTMEKLNMTLFKDGCFDGYDCGCSASVSNPFATAAYRIGHTLINDMFMLAKDDFNSDSMELLTNMFFKPKLHITGGVHKAMMGICQQPAAAFDKSFAYSLQHNLFKTENASFGLDLVALNIQRARDHGLPAYVHFRKRFGLTVPEDFHDLISLGLMKPDCVENLKNVYHSVNDVDLFPGLVLEKPIPGALVGELTAAILGEQFARSRKCDRFWYENCGQPGSFTPGQLKEIRKMTMARLLCNTIPLTKKITPEVFDIPDAFLNKPILCDDVPNIDLTPWEERGECYVFGEKLHLGQSKHVSLCVSCTCTKDGRRCRSIKVNDCEKFIEEHGEAFVKSDEACVAQCGPYLTFG